MITPIDLAPATLEGRLLALLIAGHLAADFVFQTPTMASGKHRRMVWLRHLGAVLTVHLIALLPFLSTQTILAATAITVLHGGIDRLKAWWVRHQGGDLVPFVADQLAHLIVVFGIGGLLISAHPVRFRFWLMDAWPEGLVAWYVAAWIIGSSIGFVTIGGAAIVASVLDTITDLGEGDDDPAELGPADSGIVGSGRLIGILERLLAVMFIVQGEWGGLALLMAAKSIARFEELKQRRFAEYYLVGTLASLLVAAVVGWVLVAVTGAERW